MRSAGSSAFVALTLAGMLAVEPARAAQTAPPKVSAQPVLNEPGELRKLAVGAEMDLVLQTPLDAARLKVDDRFEATAISCRVEAGVDLVLAPATARGFIGSVRAAGAGRSSVTLSFDELTADAKPQRLRASVVQVFEGRTPDSGGRLGTGSSVPPRERVALAGVLVGVGGTLTATDGRSVNLPAGTILRVRLEQPVDARLGVR